MQNDNKEIMNKQKFKYLTFLILTICIVPNILQAQNAVKDSISLNRHHFKESMTSIVPLAEGVFLEVKLFSISRSLVEQGIGEIKFDTPHIGEVRLYKDSTAIAYHEVGLLAPREIEMLFGDNYIGYCIHESLGSSYSCHLFLKDQPIILRTDGLDYTDKLKQVFYNESKGVWQLLFEDKYDPSYTYTSDIEKPEHY